MLEAITSTKVLMLSLFIDQKNNNIPNLAIGLDDFAGTGFFTREYIVATNQFNNTKFTVGNGLG